MPIAGARSVATIEYGQIKSQHPQISTFVPSEVRADWRHHYQVRGGSSSPSSKIHTTLSPLPLLIPRIPRGNTPHPRKPTLLFLIVVYHVSSFLSFCYFPQAYDAILSFSSLEHSGLGRYGDELNPWGDRQGVARAWCMTKPGGKLALGVEAGDDTIAFNAHR